MKDKDKNPYKERYSPIPKHLSPEERERWEKDLEWEEQERKRREKEGMYPDNGNKRSKAKICIKKKKSRTSYKEPYHG